jgi:hypothetical protein
VEKHLAMALGQIIHIMELRSFFSLRIQRLSALEQIVLVARSMVLTDVGMFYAIAFAMTFMLVDMEQKQDCRAECERPKSMM